ncbi:hypothetical protein EON64_11185, partial [archaeon]
MHPLKELCKPFSRRALPRCLSSNGAGSDSLVATISGDLQVRALSCQELVQAVISRQHLSKQAAQALGETLACALLL